MSLGMTPAPIADLGQAYCAFTDSSQDPRNRGYSS